MLRLEGLIELIEEHGRGDGDRMGAILQAVRDYQDDKQFLDDLTMVELTIGRGG